MDLLEGSITGAGHSKCFSGALMSQKTTRYAPAASWTRMATAGPAAETSKSTGFPALGKFKRRGSEGDGKTRISFTSKTLAPNRPPPGRAIPLNKPADITRAANSCEMTCALARELYHSDAPTKSWGWEERGAVNLRMKRTQHAAPLRLREDCNVGLSAPSN